MNPKIGVLEEMKVAMEGSHEISPHRPAQDT